MDLSEKLVLLGIGGIVGGILVSIGLVMHLFPDHKVKRSKIISAVGFIAGAILIVLGILNG